MDIYDYIDNYGLYSFDEKELNEVDIVLFSYLSYINYKDVLKKDKITINDAARTHLGIHKKDESNIIVIKDATKLLYYIKDVKRYKDCLLYNYKYEEDEDIQFGALSIEYQPNKVYVSYEGTNEQISGWKENILLGCNFPTRSHIKAIDYLNFKYTFSNKKLIIGGHSKGGNLALVAGMCANPFVRKKIEHIYNIDGPGLLSKQYNSKKFNNITTKYTHIIPDDSIVGILLKSTNYITIKTNITGPLAHHIFYWVIDNDKFKREELSKFSKELQKRLSDYVETMDKNELEHVVNNFDKVCKQAGVRSLLEIKNNYKKAIELLNASRILDKESRKSIYEIVNIIIKSYGDTTYNELKEILGKFKIEK